MPVVGAGQLEALGLRLKAAGAGGLRRQLLAGIRAGAAPLVGDVREAARDLLPKAGGLNEYVANGDIKVQTRLTGPSVGIRIVNSRANASRGGTADFGTDAGRFRHPVFGHTDRWVSQNCPPGWFHKTLEDKSPSVAPFVLASMLAVAEEICKGGL